MVFLDVFVDRNGEEPEAKTLIWRGSNFENRFQRKLKLKQKTVSNFAEDENRMRRWCVKVSETFNLNWNIFAKAFKLLHLLQKSNFSRLSIL